MSSPAVAWPGLGVYSQGVYDNGAGIGDTQLKAIMWKRTRIVVKRVEHKMNDFIDLKNLQRIKF